MLLPGPRLGQVLLVPDGYGAFWAFRPDRRPVVADYDRLRDQSVSEEELLEIIGWAALAMYNDTLADAMKMDDPARQQVLEDHTG